MVFADTRTAVMLAMLSLPGSPGYATTILKTEVTHDNDRYFVSFDVRINADNTVTRRYLTDFANFSRLSETIVESVVLRTYADGKQRVRIVLRPCILFMCKTVKKVAITETLANGDIVSTVDPAESDFRLAEERWQILPAGADTLLRYQAELVPSFSVPPLIGPWLVKYHIRRELEITCRKIETLVKDEARPVQ